MDGQNVAIVMFVSGVCSVLKVFLGSYNFIEVVPYHWTALWTGLLDWTENSSECLKAGNNSLIPRLLPCRKWGESLEELIMCPVTYYVWFYACVVLCVVLIIELLPTPSVLSVINDTQALLEFSSQSSNFGCSVEVLAGYQS